VADGAAGPLPGQFAVLKKSQGSGGGADIVFNAHGVDCFPDWRVLAHRRDNPVKQVVL